MSNYDDEREDWAAMHDWSNYEPRASDKQLLFIKDLEEQNCIFESDYRKKERAGALLSPKRADRLIKIGIKRQKENELQKAKIASCY